jgi:hypothetical protein
MAGPPKRPSFIDSWLADVREDYLRYGKRKLVPWAALACIALGVAVTTLVPKEHFWTHPEVSVVFFTAAVTINGLLLALSWASFAKIYDIAAEPKLAAFLRRNDMLRDYIFQVDFIHATQVLALSSSGAALILCVIEHLPPVIEGYVATLTVQKIALAATIATTVYALKYALGAVRIMQDLVWYSGYVSDLPPDITVHEGGKDRQGG